MTEKFDPTVKPEPGKPGSSTHSGDDATQLKSPSDHEQQAKRPNDSFQPVSDKNELTQPSYIRTNENTAPEDALPTGDRQVIESGTVINGRFILEEQLGSGGMGVVFRALDKRKQEAQDRNPYVAIKILGEEFARHPKAFMALQRESSKSQALAHPNIITVYDFDRDGSTVYMTMEQLDGAPLDRVIKKHPNGLAKDIALKIITQITHALVYAHSKAIVHSDLKPANIFVTADNTVKILDFGIARAATSVESEANGKTLFDAGELGGLTPSYASLEMFQAAKPHPADDIYALGLIAYELLTGRHPYQRKPAPTALAENLTASKVKGLKRHVSHALLGALELKREQRTASAEQFLKTFTGISPIVKWLSSILAVAIVGMIALALFRPDSNAPDIPFDQLAPSTQEQVSSALQAGREAMSFKDYNGALFFFNAAFEIHPKNPDAVKGLEAVVDHILSTVDLKQGRNTLKDYQRQVNTALEYRSLTDDLKLKAIKSELSKQLDEQ